MLVASGAGRLQKLRYLKYKNQITFYNATHGKHVLSLYNPKDVFDREDMIGIIDDIENKKKV